ncbi:MULTISPECIES: hypothetical protein [Bacillaceae]|uniref:Uncharacterized protein n=1 Tax=Domibacillus aminovorans TaxID=29332 RepID=A0A177L370_9BACI|nr:MULTISPECIES: hypothetical protein [Bacillaceae]OAH59211.1 hypothetical protein AWH48_15820 [Domibacillus aminovorans]
MQRHCGDEIEGLTSEKCLEKEYRSQIAIDYDGPKFDEDFYAATIELWHYFELEDYEQTSSSY